MRWSWRGLKDAPVMESQPQKLVEYVRYTMIADCKNCGVRYFTIRDSHRRGGFLKPIDTLSQWKHDEHECSEEESGRAEVVGVKNETTIFERLS